MLNLYMFCKFFLWPIYEFDGADEEALQNLTRQLSEEFFYISFAYFLMQQKDLQKYLY